jgi:dihydrofolate reductase
MRLSILAALSNNNVIGRNNDVPWKLSTDLRRLKSLTMGHHIVMGRKTFDSIGRPLPGRTNVVITRNESFQAEGVVVVSSLEEATKRAEAAGDPEPFILGGAEIYRLSLHLAHRMYLTRVHADVEGDTYFPDFDDVNEWRLVDSEHFEADEKNQYPFSFLTYDRVAPGGHAIPDEG